VPLSDFSALNITLHACSYSASIFGVKLKIINNLKIKSIWRNRVSDIFQNIL